MLKLKFEVNSNVVNVLLALYFCLFLNINFFGYVFNNVGIVGTQSVLFVVNIAVVSFCIHYLIFNIICIPYLFKFLVILMLLISSLANFYMKEYGVFIDIDMIRNVFETNTSEAFDLVNLKFILNFVIFGVIPSIFISVQKITYGKKFIKDKVLGILGSLVFVVLSASIFYKQYAFFLRNNREIRKLINPENWIYSTFKYCKKTYFTNREFIVLDNNVTRIKNKNRTVFILVVGETARASNFSLNGYERKTNPLLEKEDIVNFDNFYSAGTSTAISVPAMFSVYDRNDFDVNKAKYTENVMDLIEKSGMDVLWLENDGSCKNVCERIQTEMIDKESSKKYCNDDGCFDEIMIDKMMNYINSTNNDVFIVLHTMGSHGPSYYKRYPEKFDVFGPTCKTIDLQNCERQNIVNAYDNTILYTDYFLSTVINKLKTLDNTNTGLIYVSDHGESLGENGLYLHGMPYKIAPRFQTHVPMFVWISDFARENMRVSYDCLSRVQHNKFSHDNLFHSLLGLLSIQTKVYNSNYDIFYMCVKSH